MMKETNEAKAVQKIKANKEDQVKGLGKVRVETKVNFKVEAKADGKTEAMKKSRIS